MTRKKQIIFVLLLTFILILIISCISINNRKKLSVPEIISESVKEICKTKGEFRCEAPCEDGGGVYCYFDSTQHNKDDLQSGYPFLEETDNSCFGIHSIDICYDCHNTFKLRKNEILEEVSCEEFFQSIKRKNNECNNCIDEVSALMG